MKKKNYKNYVFFVLLMVFTVLITLYFSNIYENKTKNKSTIYNYLDVITYKDFDEYIIENPDSIIYLADKYDISFSRFEKELITLIEEKHIKDNIVFIAANARVINKINQQFKINLKINSVPYMLFLTNGKVVNYKLIDKESVARNVLEYEE